MKHYGKLYIGARSNQEIKETSVCTYVYQMENRKGEDGNEMARKDRREAEDT